MGCFYLFIYLLFIINSSTQRRQGALEGLALPISDTPYKNKLPS